MGVCLCVCGGRGATTAYTESSQDIRGWGEGGELPRACSQSPCPKHLPVPVLKTKMINKFAKYLSCKLAKPHYRLSRSKQHYYGKEKISGYPKAMSALFDKVTFTESLKSLCTALQQS